MTLALHEGFVVSEAAITVDHGHLSTETAEGLREL